jgi:FkbM family methyltransferase
VVTVEVTLFNNYVVVVDSRSLELGGSWQETTGEGVPIVWDAETVEFFYKRTLEFEYPTILDVGASTGSFCLLSKINQDIRGIAFEPLPQVYEILARNLVLNRLQDKMKALPLALSDYTGTAVLKYPRSERESHLACLGNPLRFQEWLEIEVPVTTLDKVISEEGIRKVDLIKIDTEGCELLILRGAENLIKNYYPDLLVECYSPNTRQFGYESIETVKLLKSWGYDFITVSSHDRYFFKRQKLKKKLALLQRHLGIRLVRWARFSGSRLRARLTSKELEERSWKRE